ncbi:GNAT family N-acetyltransferase [bacterium]|nr:GNAT family N-acetyltransferase [bacterium]
MSIHVVAGHKMNCCTADSINKLCSDCFGIGDVLPQEDNEKIWFYVTKANQIVACAQVTSGATQNTLWNVCTHSRFRCQGIMTRILTHVQKQYQSLELFVDLKKDASKTLKFYRKFGFLQSGTRDRMVWIRHS